MNWSNEITVREWWRRLAEARWSAPTWLPPFGRGISATESRVVSAELARAGVIGPPHGAIGVHLAGQQLAEGDPGDAWCWR